MKRSTMIAGAIASFAFFAPLQANAARCSQGMIYRPSIGVCVSKASAQRAGIYKPRVAKASPRNRVKRARAPERRTQIARLHPAPPAIARPPARIVPELPPIDPKDFLDLQLRAWIERNRADLVANLEAIQ